MPRLRQATSQSPEAHILVSRFVRSPQADAGLASSAVVSSVVEHRKHRLRPCFGGPGCKSQTTASINSLSYEVDPTFGCHLWLGRKDKDGYGFHGKTRAHIVAWEREFGPVPKGQELEHLCRRRSCVLTAHLLPVTRQQNEWRKGWAHRSRVQFCNQGHDKINAMVLPTGGRVCRLCSKGPSRLP